MQDHDMHLAANLRGLSFVGRAALVVTSSLARSAGIPKGAAAFRGDVEPCGLSARRIYPSHSRLPDAEAGFSFPNVVSGSCRRAEMR
jgi:hypothetical protein